MTENLHIRHLQRTEVLEAEEYFSKGQKGSSAMPHKINTVLLERMSGMPIALRGYAVMGQELIRTWLERDIAHSSVERIAFPDATILLDYMLQMMIKVFKGIVVERDVMVRGINRTRGCWASQKVKSMLCDKGFDTDDVYYFVQQCAFRALKERRSFRAVLLSSKLPRRRKTLGELIGRRELDACFDFKTPLRQNLPQGYERNGLDPSLALQPNC